MSEDQDTKFCPRCKETKPRTEFYKRKDRRDGLVAYCKPCTCAKTVACARKNPEKARLRTAKWRKNNPTRERAIRKKYYDNNKEKRAQATRKWRAKNVEHLREYERQRRLKDPDGIEAKNAAYFARLKAAEGSFTPKEWQQLCEKYAHCCAYCGKHTRLTRHHVVPLIRGGSNFISNIAPACRSCNSSIGTKIVQPPPSSFDELLNGKDADTCLNSTL